MLTCNGLHSIFDWSTSKVKVCIVQLIPLLSSISHGHLRALDALQIQVTSVCAVLSSCKRLLYMVRLCQVLACQTPSLSCLRVKPHAEGRLEEAFRTEALRYASSVGPLRYLAFDFHHETKGQRYARVSLLWDKVRWRVKHTRQEMSFGFSEPACLLSSCDE